MKTAVLLAGLSLLTSLTASAQITLTFDSVNATGGSVDATAYLASYGITETSLIGGTAFGITDENHWYGTPGIVYATSPHNFIVAQGGNSTSIRLSFSTPLSALAFTRITETGSGAGNSFGNWSATVYSGATVAGTASESGYSIFNNNVNSAHIYSFTGANITSVQFDGNDYIGSTPFYGSAGILMDNLTITPVPEPTTLALAGLGGLASLMAIRRRK